MAKTRQKSKTGQKKKVQEKPAKVCIVGYKKATVRGSLCVYGEVFDKLEPCCDKFKHMFFDTGQNKIGIFNGRIDEKDGLNLVTRGNVLTLVLRISRIPGVIYEDKINSCPFCESKVVVKCTKDVELIPRKVEVFNGYDEEVKWQEGIQTQ